MKQESAFPFTPTDKSGQIGPNEPGMSLRDYFAAHAPTAPRDMPMDEHCAFRYRYADAMLKAREVEP